MPGTDDLRSFIEERLLSYDPNIDLSEGSPAVVEIVEPLVERYSPDPFEIDLPTFIRTRLQQEYPSLSTEEGDVLVDFLVKPAEALLDPIIREVSFLRKNKSLSNPATLAPEEADALVANMFVTRSRGDYAQGRVRVYFSAPTSVSVGITNTAVTAGGLSFFPTSPQSISAEAMVFNQSGSLYYVDISFRAEAPGVDYNIDPGTIIGVSGIPGAVRATNVFRFRGGVDEENTDELVARAEDSIIERSLVVPRGAYARLFSQFGDLQHLQVVGFGDPEMQRDIITGGGLGDVLLYREDGNTTDDGDGDGYSVYVESPTGGFTTLLGAVGANTDYVLTHKGIDYPIVEIVSNTVLRVEDTGPTLSDLLTNFPFTIRKRELTLSNIPGGIVNPTGPRGEISIAPDAIHIGGLMDFYVRSTPLTEMELTLSAVSDEEPLLRGVDLQTVQSGLPTDVVRVALAGLTDFVASGVKPGHTLVIETGGDAGSYQILAVNPGSLGVKYLQVYPAPASPATGLKYRIVDDVDIDLNEPKTVRGSGSDLVTVLGAYQVRTVSEVDFAALGVAAGDTLRITGDSPNAGDRLVTGISGTGNILLLLNTPLYRTSSSESWSVFRKQDGVVTPVIRIKSVALLDSQLQPTGEVVPYAAPVDAVAFQFSNIGNGEKKTVHDGVIGILGTVDLSISGNVTAVNGKTLRLRINGTSATPITITGATTLADIVLQINIGLSGRVFAASVPVGTEQRLALRSRNNWIEVLTTGSINAFVGFSTVRIEDNRQITSPSVPDWTVYRVEEIVDAVNILTGDNVGYWYLHAVETSRLLVSRVDLNKKAVFPLTDTSATVSVGSRSFGTVRCYFLEPTSFDVYGSYFRGALSQGEHAPNAIYGLDKTTAERTEFFYSPVAGGDSELLFFPDPELEHTILPVTDEDVPDNLDVTTGAAYVISTSAPSTGPGKYSRQAAVDFLLREVKTGDLLEITYQPIQGNVDIRPTPSGSVDYPADVVGKTLVFNLENGPDRTVLFTLDIESPEDLAEAINLQLGEELAFVENTGTEKYLRLESDFSFSIKATSTIITPTDVLGLAGVVGTNAAKAAGRYVIGEVGYISGAVSNHFRMSLTGKEGDGAWTSFSAGQAGPSQHFKIYRPGLQRISATDMENNVEGTLYYADVELVSSGPGDSYNLALGSKLSVERYQSDGYTLSNSDSNLAFSTAEQLQLHLSQRFLPVGSVDKPENMIQLSRQNILIVYDMSELVAQVQNFAQSELDRVLNANILVKFLLPHFVRLTATYQGGSDTGVIKTDIEDYIDGVLPEELLETSAIVQLIRRRGATRVELPITIVGVVQQTDRSVTIEQSGDSISSGRLSTFIPDAITLTRDVA